MMVFELTVNNGDRNMPPILLAVMVATSLYTLARFLFLLGYWFIGLDNYFNSSEIKITYAVHWEFFYLGITIPSITLLTYIKLE